MSKSIKPALRLRHAISSVVERLEDRRLFAGNPLAVQSLPFALEFDQDAGGMLDKDGQGTGFTHVQVMDNGNEYAPSLIDVDTATGLLKITAQGTAAAGANYETDSALRNALETKFDASNIAGFTVGVRIVGPLDNINAKNHQAGIMFGIDQHNYIKLIATNNNGTNFIQFADEFRNTNGTFGHKIAPANSYSNIGVSFATINTLDLYISGDPTSGKVSAYYRVNGGALAKIGNVITYTGAQKDAFFGAAAAGGLIVAKKSDVVPDYTATFERFTITRGQLDRPAVASAGPSGDPANVATTAYVSAAVTLRTGGQAINAATLTSSTVRLVRTSDNAPVAATLSIDGTGSTIILQPTAALSPNTGYTFQVTDGLQDTGGAGFVPYVTTFSTGTASASGVSIAVDKTKFYFNDVRLTTGTNVAGPAQTVTIRNDGSELLTIPAEGLTIGGANADQFVFLNKPTGPVNILPGQTFQLRVAMNATSLGLKVATLTIQSNATTNPNILIALRGLGTAGVGGANEPSLAAILQLYEIPVNVGDTNVNSTDLYKSTEPLGANEEIAGMERLARASASAPITITPLAVMGVASTPALMFGYYEAGSGGMKTQLFTVPTADAQSVNVTTNGITSFEPGSKSFGLYTTWPGFKNKVEGTTTDAASFRDVYSEDALNNFATQNKHKYRFYPMKDAQGNVVANTFVVAVEEFDGSYDSNDVVFIISNVRAAVAGPEIGYKSQDGYGFDNRMVFHRIGWQNDDISDVVRDTGTMRIRNTGTQPLTITGATVSDGWVVLNAPTSPIAAGAFYDLQVKFVLNNGSSNATRNGTLTITSDDADEPTLSIGLAGFYQNRSENDQEGPLQNLITLLGYQTKVLNAGESFRTNSGKIEVLGDEVLSGYWQQADSQQPVQVRQLAAFHTQGNTATLARHAKGNTTPTPIMSHWTREGQSILPHLNGAPTKDAYATFNATGAFGFKVDAEWSDDAKNFTLERPADEGHHLRFYVAKDASGAVIANTYIMVMDYTGINYDFNDNVYLISNVKPDALGAPAGLTTTGSSAAVTLDWADTSSTNLAGYNVYRSNAATGTFTKLNAALLTDSSYADNAAPSGVLSYYRVTAVDKFGTESAPASGSGTRGGENAAPLTPTGLIATGSSSAIALDWADNSDANLAGYNVYFSTASSSGFQKLNGTLLTASSFTHASAPIGVTSYYRVVAVNTASVESAAATANAVRLEDTSPTDAAVTKQAESGAFGGGTVVASGNRNFTGSGYLDYGGAGSWGQFTVNRATAGNATVTIRYANGSTADRPFNVLVNGVSVGNLSAPPTGGGSTWQSASLENVALTAGVNTIRLVAVGSGADLDQVTVSPAVTPPPPTDGVVTLQAEEATLGGGTVVNTTNRGFTGSGYADFASGGSSAQFTLTRSAAGTATLGIRYANGASTARPYNVLVNGVNVGQFGGAPTGSGSTWNNDVLSNVSLVAGTNSIRLVAVGAGADLDQLTVTPVVTTPPPTSDPATLTLQGETATLGGGTVARAGNGGYTGSGYADYAGAGSWAEFTVARAAATSSATLAIRYANGSSSNRPFNVLVNGVNVGQFTGAPTGAGTSWQTALLGVNVSLVAGDNTIRLVAVGAGADLDQLTVATT